MIITGELECIRSHLQRLPLLTGLSDFPMTFKTVTFHRHHGFWTWTFSSFPATAFHVFSRAYPWESPRARLYSKLKYPTANLSPTYTLEMLAEGTRWNSTCSFAKSGLSARIREVPPTGREVSLSQGRPLTNFNVGCPQCTQVSDTGPSQTPNPKTGETHVGISSRIAPYPGLRSWGSRHPNNRWDVLMAYKARILKIQMGMSESAPFKRLYCRIPTLFGTLQSCSCRRPFLLAAGNDVNLLNIISNTVPTHFFFLEWSCNPESTFISARWFGSEKF